MKNYLIGIFVLLIIVIIYLMTFSQNSITTYFKLKKELNAKQENLDLYKEKNNKLKENIKKLKTNDLEYLDELARDKHDLSKPDEVIIFNNK